MRLERNSRIVLTLYHNILLTYNNGHKLHKQRFVAYEPLLYAYKHKIIQTIPMYYVYDIICNYTITSHIYICMYV